MCGNLLVELGMPPPVRGMNDAFNGELGGEREYDRHELQQSNVPLLNPQQKEVYDTVMKAIDDGNGGLFFLDAPGGTGKTFLISLLLAAIRARSDIAVADASSDIGHIVGRMPYGSFSVKVAVKLKKLRTSDL